MICKSNEYQFAIMRLIIRDDYEQVSDYVARYVKRRIIDFKPTAEKPFVLGLPTGSSPIGTYRKLIEYHQRGELSFQNVITFNMDEYVGLPRDHPESYHTFMWNTFFKHIDIKPENVHLLDGNATDLQAECDKYEQSIVNAGGIELFLAGIGPGILQLMSFLSDLSRWSYCFQRAWILTLFKNTCEDIES